MSRREGSLTPEYFAGLYAGDPDPWRFAASDYEAEKYAATLASLPRRHYASALEVGCSIGVFTRALAPRCEALTALDVVASVLDDARARCAGLDHVRFVEGAVPGCWPAGRFDLIVLAEVAYYLDRADLARLADRVEAGLAPEGDVVLVHWLGATDYPLSGDDAAEGFIALAAPFAQPVHRERTEKYRLDVLRRHSSERTEPA